jgi:hypothetical protein
MNARLHPDPSVASRAVPVCLDLPGPSRRIRVEPLRLPAPAQAPARERERDLEPAEPGERRPVERDAPEPVPA